MLLVPKRAQRVDDMSIALGEGVYSCVVGGGYEAWNGTSMATPIVSGLAACPIEEQPDISLLELSDRLLESCKSLDAPPRSGV